MLTTRPFKVFAALRPDSPVVTNPRNQVSLLVRDIAAGPVAGATNKERKRARKAGELITVTAPVSLALATKTKQAALRAVLRESRSCINRYIKVCWKNPHLGLDAATLNLVPGGSLSMRLATLIT